VGKNHSFLFSTKTRRSALAIRVFAESELWREVKRRNLFP
jgi:hypothetical protein